MATFCLLHGDWHDGSCWGPLVDALRSRGHDAIAPDLPYDDPGASFEARIQPARAALAGVSGPVVVVGHSASSGYAAVVADGTPGALLVHLCPRLGAFPPPSGGPDAFRPDFPFPQKDETGRTVWDPQAAIVTMYRGLPPETARALAKRLRPGAPAADYPLPGHPDVETVLIYASDDEFFEPAWERFMARELLGIEPIEIRGGHFPMIEDPEGLADVLDGLAASRLAGA